MSGTLFHTMQRGRIGLAKAGSGMVEVIIRLARLKSRLRIDFPYLLFFQAFSASLHCMVFTIFGPKEVSSCQGSQWERVVIKMSTQNISYTLRAKHKCLRPADETMRRLQFL